MTVFENFGLDLSRGKISFYLTTMTPEQLFQCVRVSRVEEDLDSGFQRALDASRAKKISKYLLEERVIPGAIILSCQDPSEIKYDNTTSRLSFGLTNGLFLVIDGQHRLYGYHLASETLRDLKVPVCILSGLNKNEEIQYFIDINSNQKGVPKTLRIELTKYLVDEDSIDGIRLKLFEELSQDKDFPLYGRMSSIQKGRGYLSHVPFEAAVNRILVLSPLKDLQYEAKKRLIFNFLSGVYRNLEEVGQQARLVQSAVFQAIFRTFEKACHMAMAYEGNYKVESFESVFEVLQRIDFESHSGTNEDTINKLSQDIIDLMDIDLKAKMPQQDLF